MFNWKLSKVNFLPALEVGFLVGWKHCSYSFLAVGGELRRGWAAGERENQTIWRSAGLSALELEQVLDEGCHLQIYSHEHSLTSLWSLWELAKAWLVFLLWGRKPLSPPPQPSFSSSPSQCPPPPFDGWASPCKSSLDTGRKSWLARPQQGLASVRGCCERPSPNSNACKGTCCRWRQCTGPPSTASTGGLGPCCGNKGKLGHWRGSFPSGTWKSNQFTILVVQLFPPNLT